MDQKMKALGIALLAVVAMSALVAPQAQANNITASKYPAVLKASDIGKEVGKYIRLTIGNGARYAECKSGTAETTINAPTTTVTIFPTFSECFSNGITSSPATVTMNGCSYTVQATSKTAGKLTLDCPAGKQVESHSYESVAAHLANKPLCQGDMPAQGPIGTASFTVSNSGTATEDLVVTLKGTGGKGTSTIGTAGLCGAKAGSETTGSITGSFTITGESGGAHVAIMVE